MFIYGNGCFLNYRFLMLLRNQDKWSKSQRNFFSRLFVFDIMKIFLGYPIIYNIRCILQLADHS